MDDVSGRDARRGMLEQAEVVAGRVMETVDAHDASSIDRLTAFYDPVQGPARVPGVACTTENADGDSDHAKRPSG